MSRQVMLAVTFTDPLSAGHNSRERFGPFASVEVSHRTVLGVGHPSGRAEELAAWCEGLGWSTGHGTFRTFAITPLESR